MKIGIVFWDLNISGGGQRQALELAANLQNRGHEIAVYTVYYNNKICYPDLLAKLKVQYLYETKNELFEVNIRNTLFKKVFPSIFNRIEYFTRARELVKLIDPDLDLLNIHDNFTYLIASSFKAKYKKPIVWMMNDSPLEENNYSKYSLKKIPLLFPKIIIKKNVKKIDKIIVLDNFNKNRVKKIFGVEADIVRSGLDLNNYKFIRRHKNTKLKILSNGIFFPHRRIEDLIIALKIIIEKGIEFEYHHVGSDKRDQDYANKIYKMCEELDLNKFVKFHGSVSEKMLINLYSTSDVFVFPNYPQTWGLAVFEAMACGTPVICSMGAGAHEVLTDCDNAILVPPKSPEKIAENIVKLYKDNDLWEKLHINGRRFVEENITWAKYTENMLYEFDETLKRYYG